MTHFVELAKNGVVILAKNDIVIRQGLTFDILDKNHHMGDHNWLWLWLYPIRDSTKYPAVLRGDALGFASGWVAFIGSWFCHEKMYLRLFKVI